MTHAPTILLVDNTPDTLALLGDLLLSAGYEVLYAEDGESAIQRALSSTPDLILLDIRMPGMNGFDTCRALKSLAALRHVPILCMSTYCDQHILQKMYAAGATDFIRKPFQFTELLSTIASYLPLHCSQLVS